MSASSQNGRGNRSRYRQPPRAHQSWIPKGSNPETAGSSSSRSNSSNVQSEGVRVSSPQNRNVRDSNVPQLVQEIQEKLAKGSVECMICCDMVRRSAPIWSCSSCYSIFHLNCIKKWARAPTSADLTAEKDQGSNWRCPGCQSVQIISSKNIRYTCFCGKRKDPSSDMYLTPHSCGEFCGKPLERDAQDGDELSLCPHLCVLQCHPGPCPPCKAFAPPRRCPCGKKVVATRCAERRVAVTCSQRCEKPLDCQRHRCEKLCHQGHCEICQVELDVVCFCKKKKMIISCGLLELKGEISYEDGVFTCDAICGKFLGCGNHKCNEICHPGPCGDCSLLPENINSCCCGKTRLLEGRKSCLDPIPTCTQTCGKLLSCGLHHCKETCHTGDCQRCQVPVSQPCRCGSTFRTIECFKTRLEGEDFLCDNICGKKKNCGRHRCSDRCCPLSNATGGLMDERNPHFCFVPCGKKLRCRQHSCELFCHSGYCPPCLNTIFTDLSCQCGGTTIPPPLPCGTPPPSCQLLCSVPQPCGHLASHCCHFGDCPPCAVAVSKECVGGHVLLKNIPCGSKDIRCNKLCGKKRQCGLHACGKPCHPPPCDTSEAGDGGDTRSSCGQVCGAPRRECKHTCAAICHPYTACPDVKCEFPVTISCSCGRITATVPCDYGGFFSESVFEAAILHKLPSSLQQVETTGKRVPLSLRKLVCDDECAKQERKKVLADAFDIATPSLDALFFGENPYTAEVLSELYRRDPKWVISVEERCKQLVLGKKKVNGASMKVHVFCPMLKEKRDAVRLIAERWKLAIGAAGWEPKRFIVVHVLPKSKPPARIIAAKGVPSPHAPSYNPLVDMDPRLVVSFMDLPRESDVSSLVLRFGGECELVWLNDKNALAIFNDAIRAATAMRRLDHSTPYHGAVTAASCTAPSQSGTAWGKVESSWKKAVTQIDEEEAPPVIREGEASSIDTSFPNLDTSEVADDWEQAFDHFNV